MDKRQRELFASELTPWEADDRSEVRVATVVFAEPPFGPYDYLVPEPLRGQVEVGRRLRVPLGRGNRLVVGYCVAHEFRCVDVELKPVRSVIDGEPLLTPTLLAVTRWMADYYLCPWGQVLEGVVPSGVRAKAGTREVQLLSVPPELPAALETLRLPRRQRAVLEALAAAPHPLTPGQLAQAAGTTLAPIRALREKQLIRAEVRRVFEPSDAAPPVARGAALELNEDQVTALAGVVGALAAGRHETILLHGVTGSGKTEVYIRAIEEALRFGRQAIVLVPEISLTPQTCQRFKARFADVAVLHSHLTPADRHRQWRWIASGNVPVVVGARSAVFAPLPRLGLIVIDEEHDGSFKQEVAPRYHAREVARERTRRENVPLVLGSATPALESWYAGERGDFHRLVLPRRVQGLPLPDVATIDMRSEFRSRGRRGAISRRLAQAMRDALRDGGQIILLLNRRGFATTIQCPACGFVVTCPDCDIPLTHHRTGERALCHYCDYEIAAPPACPDCRHGGIRYSGLGTQKLEVEVRARFPDAACLRMDSDSMQRRGSHEAALDRFRRGEVQILMGTQMIAKGLDFPQVTLVGVINADTALHFPDFRGAERTFQLVTQVAGRTGRGMLGGRVLVQTYSPDHPAIQAAVRHDYTMFAAQELPIRRQFGYPPFRSLVRCVLRGPQVATVAASAQQLAARLRTAAGTQLEQFRLVGPAPAPLPKLRGYYRFHILLAGDLPLLRDVVRRATEGWTLPEEVQWIVDVDPVNLL